MTDQALEDRLRRSMRTIAELPLGRLEPRASPSHPRRAVAVISVAALLVVAAVVAVGLSLSGRSQQPVTVTAPTPVRLPTPHGQNEPLMTSSQVSNVFNGPARKTLISTHALRVDGTDFTVQVEGTKHDVETWIDFPNGGGEVVGARQGESTEGTSGGKELTVWVGLPAHAAVVTYTYEGRTVWQRPLDGNAAFVHPTVTTFRDTPQGTSDLPAHPRYDPLLRAYDADGNLIAQNVTYVVGPLTGLSNVPLEAGN